MSALESFIDNIGLFSFLGAPAATMAIKIVSIFVFLFIGLLAIKLIVSVVKKWMVARNLDPALHAFVLSLTKISLIVILVISCLQMLGINTASFITALGAAGIAIGLSLQDSLSNLAGGVFMATTKPFERGNYINIGDAEGIVQEIGLVHTILTTVDNKKVLIPNKDIAHSKITNYSSEPTRRLDMIFSIGHRDSYRKAQQLIGSIIEKHPMAFKSPKPVIRVFAQTERSVDITLRVWTENANYFPLMFDLNEQIKDVFDDNGITAPPSRLDVTVIKD